MEKKLTIFSLLESEKSQNKKSENFISKVGDSNDEIKDSFIISSFNYFKESRVSGDDYFMDESELDDKSSFLSSQKENITNHYLNNSLFKESEFKKISRLGKGSYGQVFKIVHNETNKIYAVKEINKSKLIKENKYYQIIVENIMLKLCSHQNIVKYYGFYENHTNFSIVEEFCPFGDLSTFILENKNNLNINEIQYIMGQILTCLEYLSSQKIIHRDIKPENFLITKNFKLKLIDFGTATLMGKIFDIDSNKFVDDHYQNIKKPSDSFLISHKFYGQQEKELSKATSSSFNYKIDDVFSALNFPFGEVEKNNSINEIEDIKRQKFVGTAEYMSPEIINSKKEGYYSDIWSMICILYLCFTGHTPFSDKTEYLIFQNILNCKYNKEYINLIPEEALDLVKNYFKVEPSERIGYIDEKNFDFEKIKTHPFFVLKEGKIDLSFIEEQLMNKCSYYRKFLEKKNKSKINQEKNNEKDNNKKINGKKGKEKGEIDENFDNYFNEEFEDNNNGKGGIIKSGLLKKQSPYFYYDLRKIILYDTPRIDYIDPDTLLLKGSINLNKKCSAELIKNNQFKLITPKRTFIFMCKERYDISPWVSEINKAIKKYGI